MPTNIMCHFLLFTNLQTHSAHRSFVDFSLLEVLCDMRSTKCVTSVFLGTNTFPILYHISYLRVCGTSPLVQRSTLTMDTETSFCMQAYSGTVPWRWPILGVETSCQIMIDKKKTSVLCVIVNIDIHLSHLALLLLAWKIGTRNIQCKVQN